MPKITVMFGANVESEHSLEKAEMKIGRAMDCDIVVDNLGVSRHHCTIVKDGEDWALVDGGSNNGTFINGSKVNRHTLKNQDRIVLGKHSLVYDAFGYAQPAGSKRGATGMGGEMTMFVDQAALAKAMAAQGAGEKRMGIALQQGGRDVVVPLMKAETVIGSAGADIPVKGFLVKPIQAKLVKNGPTHRLVSGGGWRTVKVNGVKVAEHDLRAGDLITIAGVTLTYRAS